MINYNPKDWFIFIFRITRADTFRKLLPLMLAIGVYAGVISYLELNFLADSDANFIKNVGLMHSVLGFVISLLLVFRTNTAYDRWWEGRKIWGGLTNSSRNLAIKIQALNISAADKSFFREIIPRYAAALKSMLRENEDFQELDPVLDFKKDKHLPNQIAAALFSRVNELHANKELSEAQFWALTTDINSFTDLCGACERIKNTPIPFTYSVFIKKFIFFYVINVNSGIV